MAMSPPCNSKTDSGPKVEDDEKDPFAKLKSCGVASLTDREIFDMWRAFWDGMPYNHQTEEDERFLYFQQAIVDRPPTQFEARHNVHFYADRTKKELEGIFQDFPQDNKPNAFIFKPDIKSWPIMFELGKPEPTHSGPKVEDEIEKDPFAKLKSSGVASFTDRDIFNMWKVMNYETTKPYTSDSQDKRRYRYFKNAICDGPQTRDQFRFNRDVYADRSEEELKKLPCYKYREPKVFIFKSDIKYWPMYAEFQSLFFGGDEEPTDFVPKVEDEK